MAKAHHYLLRQEHHPNHYNLNFLFYERYFPLLGEVKDCSSASKTQKISSLLFLMVFILSGSLWAQKDYQHWSDEPSRGDWNNNILNANESNYFEGEVIPHVYRISGTNSEPLVPGTSYSFSVDYNYYQQSSNSGGFAYMTTYNISRATANYTNDVPQVDASFTDPSNGMQGDFYVVNANVTSVSGPITMGGGNLDQTVTINFTYTGPAFSGRGANNYAVFYFGLFVAKKGTIIINNAPTNGAGSFSGGSLQTTIGIENGAQSLQLNPAAIIEGSISSTKYRDLNQNGSRDQGEPGLQNWSIQLDNDADANNGVLETILTDANGNYSFSVTPGTYYVREVQQNGWTQTQPANNGQYGPITITASAPTSTGNLFGNFICVNPSVTGTQTNVNCFGQNTGAINITVSDGTPGYTYLWNDGATTEDRTNLAAGPYSVIVTDANGCTQQQQFTITQPNALVTPVLTVTQPTCEVLTGRIALTPVNGLQYRLNQGDWGAYPAGGWGGLQPGNYTVGVRRANAITCETSANTIINPVPPCSNIVYYTFTQGFYGSTTGKAPCVLNGSRPNAVALIKAAINNMPGQTLYLGRGSNASATGGSFTVPFSHENAVQLNRLMPGGGTTATLGGIDYSIPAPLPPLNSTGRIRNVLLSQTIALALNLHIPGSNLGGFTFDADPAKRFLVTQRRNTASSCTNPQRLSCASSSSAISSFAIPSSVTNLLKGKTMFDLLQLAEDALGGYKPNSVSLSDISRAVDAINNAFDGGRFFNAWSTTSVGCTITTTIAPAIVSSSSKVPEMSVAELKVVATPNPYFDRVQFSIESPVSGQAVLEVFNLLGQKLDVAYQGQVFAGKSQTVFYTVPAAYRKTLIFQLRVGNHRATGKLISGNY